MTIKQIHEKLQAQITSEAKELYLTDREFKTYWENLDGEVRKIKKVYYKGVSVVVANDIG